MNRKNLFTRTALAAIVGAISSQAGAAGFQLNEYSTSALGRAFSGEGVIADDASVGSRNPAALTMFDRPEFSVGAIHINPSVDIKGQSPIGTHASTNAGDIAPSALVPNIHFVAPINDKWAIGASGTTNFGLATDFKKDYAAGLIGGKTDLKTMNLNLSAGYRVNNQFSVGLGLNALYADAEITRHAGELPGLLGLPVSPSARVAQLKGDAWGFGWNAGLLYEFDEGNRVSFTYRSKVKVKFKDGEYQNDLPPLPMLDNLGIVATNGDTIKGKLDLNLPEIWEFAAYHRVAPKWAIHYNFAYTSWSEFKELRATRKSDGQQLFKKEEGFRDAWRVALGTTYYHDDNWTFRTGIAFDDSPVPADKRSISIPDQDRFWLSAGATYAFNKDMSVDVGLAYMHGKKVTIKEKLAETPLSPTYEFESSGKAWLYGMNFNYRF
ncbi:MULTISPECIES: long-chain fatty acid transporter FadL [Enterobacterales]|uniref:long-chain fatty acid transporter FadL n=1 Tax=Enterobacterales TaxID=91347 RepID=UPI000847F2A0|nr:MULTISPECIES: long-chain fatty acid transporter FadL [Enterobacterales]WOO48591.1 long-chain fatty acid transporter FadL [Hafnia alvei]MCK9782982.1 long-chain fatty acid transporter FadL [Proteus columbae]MCT6517006.1 long-chain fatty acid transporter FadL [Proteus vulgaris]ODQ07215.1 long-chain fatty acid transporter [Shigella sp. FC130]OEI94612.1 long-chain fatty acid transporter [Shigella sp. FC1655]